MPTTSLRWGVDIPRGPEWRSRTSAGHSAKATTLGDGVHQQGHLIADNSSQNHPGGLPGSSPSMSLTLVFSLHSVAECPSEVVTGPSLREVITDLLLNPMFKTPENSSIHNSLHSMAKKEGTPNPGEALQGYLKQPPPHGYSQVDTAHSCQSPSPSTLERGTNLTPLASLANSVNLLVDVLHLQEEMNSAMVHLLSARATMDMCHQWVISETEISHCQNETDTSEAIREIKTQYAIAIGDAKSTYGTAIRKVEAIHLASTSKVEVTSATGIRKAKAANAAQASRLQWQHQEAMQNLEEEALKEEKHAHQSFLWACGAAFQACPNDTLVKLMCPLHLLMGNPSLPRNLMVTSPFTARLRNPVTSPHCPSRPTTVVPSPRAKQCQSPE